jgi:hypothetical protein
MLIIVFGPRERNVRTLPLYQVLGVSTVCTGIYMRIKHVSLFVLVLVLGWSAPASNQTSFGISAEAKVKSHVSKTAKKPKLIVRKNAPRKAITKRPVTPPKPIVAAQVSSPSSSPTLDLPRFAKPLRTL